VIENLSWLNTLNGFSKAIADRLAVAVTRRKPKIHVRPIVGNELWCIARQGETEFMQVVCWADVTHDDPKHALMIMEVYPEGTPPQVSMGSRELIQPGTLAHIQLAAIVKPIIATKGKPWKGRLVLVDHFHRKHKTQKIEFKWVGGPQEGNAERPEVNLSAKLALFREFSP
jgi:hypothetical protein